MSIYNPDPYKHGFTCKWWIDNGVLYIEAHGNDSLYDWIRSVTGAFRLIKVGNVYYQRAWYRWAYRFWWRMRNEEFYRVESRWHSMGGAVGKDFLEILFNTRRKQGKPVVIESKDNLTYGTPRPALNRRLSLTKDFCNKWDIVPRLPFWFKSNKPIILHNTPFGLYKSHMSYNWRF